MCEKDEVKTDRVYCGKCVNWTPASLMMDRASRKMLEDEGQCRYIISIDPDHPARPQEEYGDCRVLNAEGKCKYYKDMQEGLGMVAKAGDANEIDA